jgi:hypothetical protein
MMMAAPKRPRKKPVTEDPGVLFVRGVPPELMAEIDEQIAELQKSSSLYSGLSRSSFTIELIRAGLEAKKKGGAK